MGHDVPRVRRTLAEPMRREIFQPFHGVEDADFGAVRTKVLEHRLDGASEQADPSTANRIFIVSATSTPKSAQSSSSSCRLGSPISASISFGAQPVVEGQAVLAAASFVRSKARAEIRDRRWSRRSCSGTGREGSSSGSL